MTAEELIIGHYERSLSPEQETTLSRMLDSEPEVRSLYDQHGTINGLLVAEAETIETTSKLDKVVVGAALGTLIEIAGKGIGISLLGKIAAVVATVAVGTVGFVLVDPFGADQSSRPAPAVRTNPAPTAPAAAVPRDSASPIAVDALPDSPAAAARARTNQAGDPATAARARTDGGSQPIIDLGADDSVKVTHPPKVQSRGR